jgi:hypothetical protein
MRTFGMFRRPGFLMARFNAYPRVRRLMSSPASSGLGRSLGRLYASVPLPAQSEPEALHKPIKDMAHLTPPWRNIAKTILAE